MGLLIVLKRRCSQQGFLISIPRNYFSPRFCSGFQTCSSFFLRQRDFCKAYSLLKEHEVVIVLVVTIVPKPPAELNFVSLTFSWKAVIIMCSCNKRALVQCPCEWLKKKKKHKKEKWHTGIFVWTRVQKRDRNRRRLGGKLNKEDDGYILVESSTVFMWHKQGHKVRQWKLLRKTLTPPPSHKFVTRKFLALT